jgi:MinD-like ATPase involved in chromosome partitioning or flagellar assembly
LPPGPNPFPSAYPPGPPGPPLPAADYGEQAGYRDGHGQPSPEQDGPLYGQQPGDYQPYGEGAADDWYYQEQQVPQAYPEPPYEDQQYGQEYGPGYGARYEAGYGAGYYEGAPEYGPPEYGPPEYGGTAAEDTGYAQPGMRPDGVEALAPLPPRGHDGQQATETADSLTSESLLAARRPVPESGWRRAVYLATAGLVRPGESQAERQRREMIARARTAVTGGHHRVAVMSLKGGVGKTTTTVGLGSMLASLRGDRVIAVDANPDRGTLSDKVRLETAATVRDLLNEREQIRRYADVRAFTTQAPSRLEVLASDRDPTVSVAFSEDDYYEVAQVLEHFYSICITDCGTGLLHSAMAGVLALADQIVLVSSPSVDGARSASATLDWLDAHDYGDLVRNAVVVLSVIRPRSKSTIDLDRLEQHFAGRCRAVSRIPYDPYLEEGAEVDLERLSPETADTYLALAATVGDGFAWPRSVQRAAAS